MIGRRAAYDDLVELEEPDDPDGESEDEPDGESEDEPDEVSDLDSDPDRFFFEPDLKSVSYQPPPFNRKPAADTFLTSFGSLHSGQTLSGSSLTFCRVSNSCPQWSHRYS